MALSTRPRHPNVDDLYAFLKGKISRQRHAELQEHLATCPECARRTMHGRVVMKSLERWTDQLPGPELSRLLVRSALSRALRSDAIAPDESERISVWLNSEPADYAGWFHFDCEEENRMSEAFIPRIFPVVEGKIRMLVEKGEPSTTPKPFIRKTSTETGEDKPWLAVRTEGQTTVRFRYHPHTTVEDDPLVLMVPCETKTQGRLKRMVPSTTRMDVVEASFDGLTFGPYVVAVEPMPN